MIKHWELSEKAIIQNYHIKNGKVVNATKQEINTIGAEYKVIYSGDSPLFLKVDKKWIDENDGFWEKVIYYWSGYQWEWFDWLTYNLNR
jgi:hypothetical protein